MTRRHHIAGLLAIAVITTSALVFHPTSLLGQQIYLDIEEQISRPGNIVPVSIFVENLGDSIQAFQMGITLDRPDIMSFQSDTVIQTCYECADSACTSVVAFACTVAVVPVTAEGSLTQNWEFVQANTFGSFDIRITGIADTDFDGLPGPVVPFTNGILVKVQAQVFCDIPDTLQDRTVTATISPVNTYFSNTVGELIEPLDFTAGTVTVLIKQRGDFNGDGFVDAVDLALAIDQVFFGGAAPCPEHITDMSCDGFADALDLAWLIDYIFFGGSPAPC
ncbi:MAG: dockerin type I domain-containing protein [Candidatus Zixiibacteriota bacterium]